MNYKYITTSVIVLTPSGETAFLLTLGACKEVVLFHLPSFGFLSVFGHPKLEISLLKGYKFYLFIVLLNFSLSFSSRFDKMCIQDYFLNNSLNTLVIGAFNPIIYGVYLEGEIQK